MSFKLIDSLARNMRERLALTEALEKTTLKQSGLGFEQLFPDEAIEKRLLAALADERDGFTRTESARYQSLMRQQRLAHDRTKLDLDESKLAAAEAAAEVDETRRELGELELENAILRARLNLPTRPTLSSLN